MDIVTDLSTLDIRLLLFVKQQSTYLVGRGAHGALRSELQTTLVVRVVHGPGWQLRVRIVLLLHGRVRQTSAKALTESTSANILLLPSKKMQHFSLMGPI